MPRNNGVYTLPPVYFAEDGEIIQPNQHNIPLQDVAQALTGSVPRDGTAAMTGDLPMGGRKVTGLGSATAPGDAVRLDQLPATSGWLSSVAALTMAADRIPYATGVTTAALAVFTAAGRAVVGAVDAAAQRVALGLGALATKNKAAVSDIDATGTPGADNFLRGDGAWASTPIKAWVRFNGAGGATILSSFNVSSVSRNSTGDYTINFTTPMQNSNYGVLITAQSATGAHPNIAGVVKLGTTPATSSVQITTGSTGGGSSVGAMWDSTATTVMILG